MRCGVVQVAAKRVAVVDTVGAGDTFNAGVLASLAASGALTRADVAALDAATLARALELGAAAAAVTVSRAGANPPFAHEL
jgi:fructokinase